MNGMGKSRSKAKRILLLGFLAAGMPAPISMG